jgi:hypothetical protein
MTPLTLLVLDHRALHDITADRVGRLRRVSARRRAVPAVPSARPPVEVDLTELDRLPVGV